MTDSSDYKLSPGGLADLLSPIKASVVCVALCYYFRNEDKWLLSNPKETTDPSFADGQVMVLKQQLPAHHHSRLMTV